MTEVRIPQHETVTPSNGVLVTIRSDKSFFEVSKDVESRLQRFSIPKLMEYVTHGDREGLVGLCYVGVSPGHLLRLSRTFVSGRSRTCSCQ